MLQNVRRQSENVLKFHHPTESISVITQIRTSSVVHTVKPQIRWCIHTSFWKTCKFVPRRWTLLRLHFTYLRGLGCRIRLSPNLKSVSLHGNELVSIRSTFKGSWVAWAFVRVRSNHTLIFPFFFFTATRILWKSRFNYPEVPISWFGSWSDFDK